MERKRCTVKTCASAPGVAAARAKQPKRARPCAGWAKRAGRARNPRGTEGRENTMPASKLRVKPDAVEDVEMDHALEELSELALRFPFRWFSLAKVGRICGFGHDVMTVLAGMGAPIVGRKCNPN